MENFKRGGEFSVDLVQDLVGHLARVLNGVEPLILGHLFLGHVCLSHGTDCGPCTFSQPIGGLAPGGGTNDLVLRAIDPAAGVTPKDFLVAVTAELLGERAGISTKLFEGLDDAFGHERLHSVEQNVLGGTVDEKDGVSVTQLADGVAKKMSRWNLSRYWPVGARDFPQAPLHRLENSPIEGHGSPPRKELGILRGAAKVFVVA